MARPTGRQQPPPPPRSPFLGPGTPGLQPPRPPADPALQQRAWAALMLALISLIGTMMIGNARRGVYVVVLALAIAAVALWLALSAISRARRGGSGRPRGVVLAAILGSVGILFGGLVLARFAMFWPQLTQYSNCLNGANTVTAQQACQQQLNNSISTEVGLLGR